MANPAATYERLRRGFQRLHSNSSKSFVVMHWRMRLLTKSEAADLGTDYELLPLGEMSVPEVDVEQDAAGFDPESADQFSRRQKREFRNDLLNRRKHSGTLLAVAATESQRRSVEVFTRLAEEAANLLPSSMIAPIPMSREPLRSVSRWLEFVYWRSLPRSFDVATLCHDNIDHIPLRGSLWMVCRESAQAIVDCQLNSETSVCRPPRGQWPAWAGDFSTEPVDRPREERAVTRAKNGGEARRRGPKELPIKDREGRRLSADELQVWERIWQNKGLKDANDELNLDDTNSERLRKRLDGRKRRRNM
ncbi:MAG: hypothetical protein ACYTGL_26520 [Planctomycetota bacterium]|jgi:hypothetical protein